MSVLGHLTPEVFLRDYWQKKPLLLKKTYTKACDLITADELAGLATEEHISSRLVLEKAGEYPWQVKHGPFKPKDFDKLPQTHWSLLVQAVDRRVAEISDLLNDFTFIPQWRVDDIMISYAPDQGSVGPHLDRYDVFLIQIKGKRRWEISSSPVADDFLPDLDLRILRNFKADETYVLEEGDVLYLPPRFAHHGVALGECMTMSVGFRAPCASDLLEEFAKYLKAREDEEIMYEDPDLHLPQNPGELSPAELDKLRQLLAKTLERKDYWPRFIGHFVTTSRDQFKSEPETLSIREIDDALMQKMSLKRLEGGRMICMREAGKTLFFAEGVEFLVPVAAEKMATELSRMREIPVNQWQNWWRDKDCAPLLKELLERGLLYFS